MNGPAFFNDLIAVPVVGEAWGVIGNMTLGNPLPTLGAAATDLSGASGSGLNWSHPSQTTVWNSMANNTMVNNTISVGDSSTLTYGNVFLVTQVFVMNLATGAVHSGSRAVRMSNATSGVWEASLLTAGAAPPIDRSPVTYRDLFAAIERLETLDDEDSRYIDSESARGARAFVSLLSLYSVPAPQFFSHGGDTIVFKWTQADRARYVTLVEGTASLRTYVSGQAIGPPRSFKIGAESELVTLMLGLGGKRWRAVKAA